ncbi:hypothetical protein GX586_09530 [bacterium]|nr:hypothetical protein [bacterium]
MEPRTSRIACLACAALSAALHLSASAFPSAVSTGDVIISEFAAATSARLLTWTDDGRPRMGMRPQWHEVTFDDREWRAGRGGLGYRAAGAGTSVTCPAGSVSCYLRHAFVPSPADLERGDPVILTIDFEEGFVAYLNGVEIKRRAVEAPGGFSYHDQFASHTLRTAGVPESFAIGIASNVLRTGTNVLAVHVHWVSSGATWRAIPSLAFSNAPATTFVHATNIWRYSPGNVEPVGGVREPPEGVDWIELWNRGTSNVPLAGWSLTDDPALPRKWVFPQIVLTAGQYLVVQASGLGLPATNGYGPHTTFELGSGGEYLALFDNASPPRARTLFSPGYPDQSYFHSCGIVDGAGQEYRYLSRATPGQPNDTGETFDTILPEPVFDMPQGFYDGAIDVAVITREPGAFVRYTTDGREPTLSNGYLYTGPVHLAVTNCALRARAFRPGSIPSRTASRAYLLNQPAVIKTLPAFVMIGDEERDFFCPHGVMAVSGGYSNWWSGTNWAEHADWYKNGIYRGQAYERPIVTSFINPADNSGFVDVGGGIRAAGEAARLNNKLGTNWASSVYKYNLKIYFRGRYGSDRLYYHLFPESTRDAYSAIAFRGAVADDCINPAVKDELIKRIHLDCGQMTFHGTYANLFINGTFKTYYNVCERPDIEFFQDYYGGEAWEYWKPPRQKPVDQSYWNGLRDFVKAATNDPALYKNFAFVDARVDLASFADYLLVCTYSAVQDWPGHNYVMSRPIMPGGKYRFYSWDNGSGFNASKVTNDHFAEKVLLASQWTSSAPVTILFSFLKRSPEGRLFFADRINKHFFHGGALSDQNVSNRFAALREVVRPMVFYQQKSFNNDVETKWIPQRRAAIFRDYVAQGIWPTNIIPPEFSQHGGWVSNGFPVAIVNSNEAGIVYYTTDASDPRGTTGIVQGITYAGPFAIDRTTTVKARVLDGDVWSPLTEATFSVTDCYAHVAINEVLAHARPPLEGAVELFNAGTTDVAIGGWHLSDHALNLRKYRIPDGTVISARSYHVFYEFQFNAAPGTPSCFALNERGGEVHLTSPEEPPFHHTSVSFGGSEDGVSFGPHVTSDGMGQFTAMRETSFGTDVRPGDPPSRSNEFRSGAGAANPGPLIGPVIISEIMYHPAAGGDEFIELYNSAPSNIVLCHAAQPALPWSIEDDGGAAFALPWACAIASQSYVVIVGEGIDPDAFRTKHAVPEEVPVLGPCLRSFGNGGDCVKLFKPDSTLPAGYAPVLVEEVPYRDGSPWPREADGDGPSLQRISPESFSADPSSWQAGVPGGSPGRAVPEPACIGVLLLSFLAQRRRGAENTH